MLAKLLAVSLLAGSVAQATVTNLFQLPAIGNVLENLALRQNGNILATRIDAPEVWEIAPNGKNASLLFTFPGATGASGIREVEPNIFAVAVAKISSPVSATDNKVWTLDMTLGPAKPGFAKIRATVTAATVLNGMAVVPGLKRTVLCSDHVQGAVYAIDLVTGSSRVVIADKATMLPVGSNPDPNFAPVGVNGLALSAKGDTLYYTSSFQGALYAMSVDPQSGESQGPAQLVATLSGPDDLALGSSGETAYVASQTDSSLSRVTLRNGHVTTLVSSKEIAGPSAVALHATFNDVIYLSTFGGLLFPVGGPGGFQEPGKVAAVFGFLNK